MINIKKDNGTLESLDISKIKKQTIPACAGLKGVNHDELELDSNIQFIDGMSSKDIHNILINTAVSKIDIDSANWTFVASRLFRDRLYKNVGKAFGKSSHNIYEEVSLREYVTKGVEQGILREELLEVDLELLNTYLIPENDDLFNYLGILTLKDKYIKNLNLSDIPFEAPQHLFMANAIAININETVDKEQKIKELYETFSKLELLLATPSLSNARLKNKSCFSCFVGSSADDLNSLFEGYTEQALISKYGGGIGWDYSRMRSMGGIIQNILNASAGKVPFLKFNDTIVNAIDQLGVRKGAIKVYIECWDLDIFDFIDLKKQSGEERRRAHDLFTCVSVNDVFKVRIENDDVYTLFDPYDTPDLCETFGDEFKLKYESYEVAFKEGKIRGKEIKAKDLWKKMILAYFEIGSPDLFFKDTANRTHKNKHLGIVRSLNLCNEFKNPVNEKEIAVCNLASINMSRVRTPEDVLRVSKIAIRALDNIIDISSYPVAKAEVTQKQRRSVGLGFMGEAELLATSQIMFGSKEHEELLHKMYGALQQGSIKASSELAIEKGCYPMWEGSDWHKDGIPMRNGYLNCVAPTSSISILAGTTQAIEPVYKRKWFEENLSGLIPVVAPNLDASTWEYYVTAYDVDQLTSVRMNAIRQKYIDMTISFNIFVDPKKVTGKDINDILMLAWNLDLESTYYLRSKSPEIEKEVVDRSFECTSCQ